MIPSRIMERILIRTDGCWEWQGYRDRLGYGTVGYENRRWYVHRLTYTLLVGPVTGVLDHLCRFSSCCNPTHLEDVDQFTNVNRGLRARKEACGKGHPFTENNTLWKKQKDGRAYRRCKRCHADNQNARYHARRMLKSDAS